MAAGTHKIFIDSSILLSFVDRTDLDHAKVCGAMEELAKQGIRAYTSSLVIQQTYTKMEKELGAIVAADFLQAILDSNIITLYPSDNDYLAASRMIKSGQAKKVELSQIINSHLMEKNSVSDILTLNTWHNLLNTRLSSLIAG